MFNTSTNAIWVVPVTGGKAVRVSDSTHVNVSPVWAPDGKSLGRRMVFYTVRGDNTASVLEVTRNAQGTWSAPHRLTPETEAALNPQWSPDGSMIAYVRAGAGSTGQGIVGREVAILPTASGPATVLAGTKAVDGSTQAVFWGKSSATVYASVLDARGGLSIWAVPVAGEKPQRILAENVTHRFGRPEFATDGRRFFFTLASWESDVYVADLKH